MKVQMLFGLLFFGIVHTSLAAQCPGDKMINGWCWPTKTSNIGNYLGWHGYNPGFSGNHLAQDIDADEGDDVYSIADNGTVVKSRNDVRYYGGATNCNSDGSGDSIPGGGVVIRYVDSNDRSFDVLYAHLKSVYVSDGEIVNSNTKIGKIRNYTWCGNRMDHLHFGIRFPANDDDNRWAGYGNTNKGFVDPINFLNTHYPNNNSNSNPQTEQEVHTKAYANSGRLAWLPLGSSCKDATKWIDIDTGTVVADKSIQSVDGNYVCENYGIYPNCGM